MSSLDRRDYWLMVVSSSILCHIKSTGMLMVNIQSAEKLSITLPFEMAKMVRDKVEAGIYGSNSEVIRDALRSLMERERRLIAFDEAIAKGIADADAGRVEEIENVRIKLHNRFEQ